MHDVVVHRLRLKKNVSSAVRRGHPWVFRDALAELPPAARAGDVADLICEQGRWLARGTVDPGSPLAFRVWSLDPSERVDASAVWARLEVARRLRQAALSPDITGYRVCHGEGDDVPGLHADLYGDVASLSTDGGLGLAWEGAYVDAIQRVWAPRAVVVRNRLADGGAARVVAGKVDGSVVICEGARRFAVDVLRGQKTGFFVDQRPNRDRVATLAPNATVLNLFSYTGGFSVAAALAGARRVVSVDLAAPAIQAAQANFELNGIAARAHGFEVADAFEFLASLGGAPFDVVVCDPPAFAPSQKVLPKARAAYVRLNALALKAVVRGGWLATASCSSHVSPELFVELLAEAAVQVGRRARLVELGGAGPDHPVRLGFPEGRYLKFALLWVD